MTFADNLRHWADTDPDRAALEVAGAHLSFRDLEQQARSLGRRLQRTHSVNNGCPWVPVIADRSLDAYVSIVACLYARVPFVIIDNGLDPRYAREIYRHIGTPELAVQSPEVNPQLLPPDAQVIRVQVAATTPDHTRQLADARADEAPGMLVFTSGSTAAPKGIVIPWGALEARWRTQKSPHIPAGHVRVPLLSGNSTTATVMWLGQVCSGATIRVLNPTESTPLQLIHDLADSHPTQIVAAPQMIRVLAQLASSIDIRLPQVRHVLFTGEAPRFEFVAAFRGVIPDDAIVTNTLASSEGGRMFEYSVRLGDAPTTGPIPVGRPTRANDIQLLPRPDVADDVVEVIAGGDLALGYLEPDPNSRFSVDARGRRWWRSGDLLRVQPDGDYQHVGRADDLVQVNGQVASPAIVTEVLLSLTGVLDALVLPEPRDGTTRLVGHVVVDARAGLTRDGLRAELAARLPRHMVPPVLLRHAILPLGPGGKVDRQALQSRTGVPW